MSTNQKKPISPLNIAFFILFGIITVAAFTTGHYFMGVVFLATLAFFIWSIWLARKTDASEFMRVNTVEYADERDEHIGQRALAAAGGYAIIMLMAVSFSTVLFQWTTPATSLVFAAMTVSLCFVWGGANIYFARRM